MANLPVFFGAPPDLGSGILILVVCIVVFFFWFILGNLARYKKCPSDKILVVYGKLGKDEKGQTRSSICMHGGATFVWPIIQDYAYLDLTPITIDIPLKSALSKQNIRINVPSTFTVGISTDEEIMNNAAERLLGIPHEQVKALAQDIIFGQLRVVIATMDIEEINSDRDKFLDNVVKNVEAELKKIGLKLINVNITDITDESGYIEALGKEAAAKAVNEARKSVSEKNRDGAVGQAEAEKDQTIKVSKSNSEAAMGQAEAEKNKRISISNSIAEAKAGEAEAEQRQRIKIAVANANAMAGEAEAEKEKRIRIAKANAEAVAGENQSKIAIAETESLRRQREAEANSKAVASEKKQAAKALEEAYLSEKMAEEARALREKASQTADIIVPAEIEKSKVEIEAEAEAERIRREARGHADALYFNLEAQARGNLEILSKQAEGLSKIVGSAGGDPRMAAMLLIVDKLPELMKFQAEAIKGIKIDKVVVWDNMGGGNGSPTTANFISGMVRSLPAYNELFKMAGMQLPEFLGKSLETGEGASQEPLENIPDAPSSKADAIAEKIDRLKEQKAQALRQQMQQKKI